MLRNQITLKLVNSAYKIAEGRAKRYSLSKSNLIEMLFILSIINSEHVLTEDEVNEFVDGLILNKESKNRKEFRELHKTMPKEVKIEILKFIYNINMIDGVDIQTRKQANFNKNKEFIFYYAIDNMRETDIDIYVNDLGINVSTIGIQNKNSKEYIYIGREQWFKNSSNTSKKFDSICLALGINEPCDCLKIHYKELYKLITIVNSI